MKDLKDVLAIEVKLPKLFVTMYLDTMHAKLMYLMSENYTEIIRNVRKSKERFSRVKKNKIVKVHLFVKNHSIENYFINFLKNNDPVLVYNNWFHYIEKYDLCIWGALFNKDNDNYTLDNLDKLLKNIYNTYDKITNKILQKEIVIPSKENEIIHLNTIASLKEEGKRMNHCVGGYFYQVENNYSMIFSLKKEKVRSTVEIMRDEKGVYYPNEHKGPSNSKPDVELNELLRILINYLNNSLKEYSIFKVKDSDKMFVNFESFLADDISQRL